MCIRYCEYSTSSAGRYEANRNIYNWIRYCYYKRMVVYKLNQTLYPAGVTSETTLSWAVLRTNYNLLLFIIVAIPAARKSSTVSSYGKVGCENINRLIKFILLNIFKTCKTLKVKMLK